MKKIIKIFSIVLLITIFASYLVIPVLAFTVPKEVTPIVEKPLDTVINEPFIEKITATETEIEIVTNVETVIIETILETEIIVEAETEPFVETEPLISIEEVVIETQKADFTIIEPNEEYEVANHIWNFLQNKGFNNYVIAGLMGNMMGEAGGHSLNIQPYVYSATGNYYGICQWNRWGYPEVQGQDLNYQLQFLCDTLPYEMNRYGVKYRKNFNYESFLNLQSVEEATKAFQVCYERGGIRNFSRRYDNAWIAYTYFVN